jgi:hypothetical protein
MGGRAVVLRNGKIRRERVDVVGASQGLNATAPN